MNVFCHLAFNTQSRNQIIACIDDYLKSLGEQYLLFLQDGFGVLCNENVNPVDEVKGTEKTYKLEAKIELTPAQQKCRQYQNAQLKAMKLAESGFNNRHMFVSIWFTNNDPIARDRFPAPAEQAAAWARITKSTGWDCGEMLNVFHG